MTEVFIALVIMCGVNAAGDFGCTNQGLLAKDKPQCQNALANMLVMSAVHNPDYQRVRAECVPVTYQRGT